MKIKDVLLKANAVFVVAACIIGLFAVTGFPEPMSRQLFIAVGTALILQVALTIYGSRKVSGSRQVPDNR